LQTKTTEFSFIRESGFVLGKEFPYFSLIFSFKFLWQEFINPGLQQGLQPLLVSGFLKYHCAVTRVRLKNPNDLLSLKDLMAFNSFMVVLGLEDLDFSNMDPIFHLNSMPRGCGSLETTDSTAHAISRLECG
jgi:hypothetical protein